MSKEIIKLMSSDEELVQGWPVCSGWIVELMHYYNPIKNEQFTFSPICNHCDNDSYVPEESWWQLVTMFGLAGCSGNVYDPVSVKPKMIKKSRIESKETQNFFKHIANHNNWDLKSAMVIAEASRMEIAEKRSQEVFDSYYSSILS